MLGGKKRGKGVSPVKDSIYLLMAYAFPPIDTDIALYDAFGVDRMTPLTENAMLSWDSSLFGLTDPSDSKRRTSGMEHNISLPSQRHHSHTSFQIESTSTYAQSNTPSSIKVTGMYWNTNA